MPWLKGGTMATPDGTQVLVMVPGCTPERLAPSPH